MANPQAENGHIDIAIEIAEQLARTNLRAYESRTLWALWRKTWGWHKKEDRISITQFQKLTGLKRRHQHNALQTLRDKNIIICNTNTYIVTYSFQKDYTKWQTLLKQVIPQSVTHLSNAPLPEQVTKPLLKQVPTKENKETIKKKSAEEPTYIQKIIEVYKKLKSYDTQLDWDKYHYKRHTRAAKELYEVAGEEWQGAMEWVVRQKYSDWTLETVIKKFPDYRKSKQQLSLGAAGRILNE